MKKIELTDKELYTKFVSYLTETISDKNLAKSYAHRVVIYCLDNNMSLKDLCSIKLFELLHFGGRINKYYRAGLVQFNSFLFEVILVKNTNINEYIFHQHTNDHPGFVEKEKNDSDLISNKHVYASALNMTKGAFYRMLKKPEGKLLHRIDVGGRVFYTVESVNNYLKFKFDQFKY